MKDHDYLQHLENAVASWLADNRSLSIEQRRHAVSDALSELSKAELLDYAVSGFICRDGLMLLGRATLDGMEKNFRATAPIVARDSKRQKGTKAERLPEINDWIAGQLKRRPDIKSPELWVNAPDWITDQIGEDAFKKRVTKQRKRVASN